MAHFLSLLFLLPRVIVLLNIEGFKLAGRVLGFVFLPHRLELTAEIRLGLPCAVMEREARPLDKIVHLAFELLFG